PSSRAFRAAVEIDEPALDIGMDELAARDVTDVEVRGAVDDLAYDRGAAEAHPRPLRRGAGHDRVEALRDARREEERGGGFPGAALHLGRVVLLRRAMRRERAELVESVRCRLACERRFEQP